MGLKFWFNIGGAVTMWLWAFGIIVADLRMGWMLQVIVLVSMGLSYAVDASAARLEYWQRRKERAWRINQMR